MDDTPPEIKKHYQEMLLSKSPLERLRMVSRMFDSVKKLAIAGILMERPYFDLSRLQGELFLRIYGKDFSNTERKRITKKIPNRQSTQYRKAAAGNDES
jgi:hypothetical protein